MTVFDVSKVSIKKIREGYEIAEKILLDDELYRMIAIQKKFTYTQDRPEDVALKLRQEMLKFVHGFRAPFQIKEYFENNPNVIGATTFGESIIYTNVNGASRKSVVTFIGNGGHETGHAIGYKHGSDWQQYNFKGRMMCRILLEFEDKNLSVPNTLARLVVELAKTKGLIK